MKIIVCGSREADHQVHRKTYMRSLIDYIGTWRTDFKSKLIIIEGNCPGVDQMAGEIAWDRGIGLVIVNANWDFYGKRAGPLRNRWMAALKPDQVVGFHHDWESSKGTRDMLNVGDKLKIPTMEVQV